MPRVHTRKLGSRTYHNYSDSVLAEAILKVENGELSMRAASKKYKISFGTLHNRLQGKHSKPIGGQTVLSKEEEECIIHSVTTCADWGYPMTILDLRLFAKSYLDSVGRQVNAFQNNLPGVDWAYSMLKRHKSDIGQRLATNISRARADVSKDILEEYFNNLKETVDGIPPSHLFNYDESNVTDDPGKKLCLYRRGVKYPEKVMNHTKASTTIMICGTASGVLLPPYILYRSQQLWDQWRQGGPKGKPCCDGRCCAKGSRYNRTPHGWMEASCFTDWFSTVFLPHAKLLDGRKVIIGDNLASHFTNEVLDLCKKNDISFVCLPANSTHRCQPLDVAFFRPFTAAWKSILTEWKMKNPKHATVQKDIFPSLVQQALKKNGRW